MYTKPFDSVQDAISLFEQRIGPSKNNTSNNKVEKDGEFLKDHEEDIAIFGSGTPHKSPKELLSWLKLYKAETEKYKEKFRKARELFFEFEKADESIIDAERQTACKETDRDYSMNTSELNKAIFSSELLEDSQSQKQVEVLTRKMEVLENELLKEMIMSEYLRMELKQSKVAQSISLKYVLSTMNELDLVKLEAEKMKLICSERGNYIIWIEEQGKRTKELLKTSSENVNLLNEIQRMQEELSESNNRVLEMQAKVTNLTSELRNSAEASQTDKAKKGTSDKDNDKGDASKKISAFCTDVDSNGFCTGIVISLEEYDLLIQKSAMAENMKSTPGDGYEIGELRRELEDRKGEISELTCRFETTLRRAEMAEKAKLQIEEQLRMWREQKRLRRAASEALKEYASKNPPPNNRQNLKPLYKCAFSTLENCGVASIPRRTVCRNDGRQSKNIPLGKFLKIKF